LQLDMRIALCEDQGCTMIFFMPQDNPLLQTEMQTLMSLHV